MDDLQIFFGFIGCLILCSIALGVLVINFVGGVIISSKNLLLYGLLSAILTALVAFFVSYLFKDPFQVFWLFGLIFLVFGMLNVIFNRKLFRYSHKDQINRVLLAEVLFGFAVILFTLAIFAALQFFRLDRSFLFYPVIMSALVFFVPLLISHSFRAATGIPAAEFPTWEYPLDKSLHLPEITRSDREFIIAFEVAEKLMDKKLGLRVYAYENWQLGTLFHHFLNEYQNGATQATIEYVDKEGEPYRWWFHKKTKWYKFRDILNPEFSIRESGIKENTVIICERLIGRTGLRKFK